MVHELDWNESILVTDELIDESLILDDEDDTNTLALIGSNIATELSFYNTHNLQSHQETVNALYFNTSVTSFRFLEGDGTMTEEEWLLLLSCCNTNGVSSLTKLTATDPAMPFHILPTFLWTFRNLRKIVLWGACSGTDLEECHLTTLSAALHKHPSLEHFVFRHPAGSNIYSCPDDCALALSTAPKLTVYILTWTTNVARATRRNWRIPPE